MSIHQNKNNLETRKTTIYSNDLEGIMNIISKQSEGRIALYIRPQHQQTQHQVHIIKVPSKTGFSK